MIAGRFKSKLKNNMAKNNQLLVYIVIGVVAALALGLIDMPSGISDIFSSGDEVDELYPSDLKTTVTLNTGDALATTATNANVSYYVFDSSGKYLKEGTTSSGTASFTVPSGGNYRILIYDDSSATAAIDYLPIEVTFSTDGDSPADRAVTTVNVDLFRESNITVEAIRDPVDLDRNVSQGVGQTVNFEVLISAETSNAVINKPILRIEGNSTCLELVTFPSLDAVTCPDRITLSTERKAWCFKYNDQVKSSDGIKTFAGNLKMDASTACPTASDVDNVNITVMDTGIYKEANYKTAGYSAFKYGSENPISNANIGAGDSNEMQLVLL